MEPIPFPHYASTAKRILMWTPDQVIPLCCMFLIGLMTDTLTFSLLVGIALSWVYSKYSAGKPDGFVLHALYWFGLVPLKARSAINPFNRRILPK